MWRVLLVVFVNFSGRYFAVVLQNLRIPRLDSGVAVATYLVDTTRRVASATRPPPFFCSHDACGLGTVIVDEKALRVSRHLFSDS